MLLFFQLKFSLCLFWSKKNAVFPAVRYFYTNEVDCFLFCVTFLELYQNQVSFIFYHLIYTLKNNNAIVNTRFVRVYGVRWYDNPISNHHSLLSNVFNVISTFITFNFCSPDRIRTCMIIWHYLCSNYTCSSLGCEPFYNSVYHSATRLLYHKITISFSNFQTLWNIFLFI